MPRRIQSMGNLCLGGKTRRKNYREEKIWGKDGAKPEKKVNRFGNVLIKSILIFAKESKYFNTFNYFYSRSLQIDVHRTNLLP